MFTRNEQWRRARELFDTAVELETGERKLFLDKACAGDMELRGEVLSLIEAGKALSFIERPAYEFAAGLLAADEGHQAVVGRRYGAYKIIREIGRGGMGTVFLAERADDEYQKRVAIKIIKRGMDTDYVLRRFRNKRQILAQLEHPNIARLLDGGMTEDGLPYFVMEYVEGQALNDYADAHNLSTTERLKLFRTICSAVAYAHQNLVIHRDLKPSNILVTSDGAPKLLDFGIAKLLHSDEESTPETLTQTGMRAMTPDYASPEQVRGEHVTTATDVYSLGVVLYELLTGVHPVRLKKLRPDEIARVICEEEPERPSRAIADRGRQKAESKDNPQFEIHNPKFLRGDLDNIILAAMRKEPARRYASVQQFAEDIRRHLEGLPVLAHKDTFPYRAGKFIRRHKVGVAAVVLVLLSLVTGIAVALTQARHATKPASPENSATLRNANERKPKRRAASCRVFSNMLIRIGTGAGKAELMSPCAKRLTMQPRALTRNSRMSRKCAPTFITLSAKSIESPAKMKPPSDTFKRRLICIVRFTANSIRKWRWRFTIFMQDC